MSNDSPPTTAPPSAPGRLLPEEDAARAYRSRWAEDARTGLGVVPPRLAWVLWPLTATVLAALIVLSRTEIFIASPGPGLMEASQPIRLVRAPVTGVVQSVEARSGQALEAGAVIARLVAASAPPLDVRAPLRGRLEGLEVFPGDFVVAGAALGRLVPDEPPSRAVALVSERDRPLLEVGQEVRLDIEEMPALRFGHLVGRIERLATTVASDGETARVLGERPRSAPAYFVELAVIPDATYQALRPRLRPGMRLACRFPLRRVGFLSAIFPSSARSP
jgi:multidrug efflux pump subunit AcrA (membrane-fusion protein)